MGSARCGPSRHAVRMVRFRPAVASDGDFLVRVLQMAADWRPGSPQRPVGEVLGVPAFAHYVEGWPRPGDLGAVAEDDAGSPLGATWCRTLPVDDPGFGFVAPDVPELTIGVVAEARGRGIGRRLLEHLIEAAREARIDRISLSVEHDNPAMSLYQRVGFVTVAKDDGATTMLLDLR
jgi:ribosomal protein S18 acetylase RimI-like enzyme